MADLFFDRTNLVSTLCALADLLHERGIPHQTLIVVGGSSLALMDLREATRDIDTVTRLDEPMRLTIADLASTRDLDPQWLNDHAAAFRPVGLSDESCTAVFLHPTLTVLVPSADWLFLMKLYAARTIDHGDMVNLWPRTGFASAHEAHDRFRAAYPHASEDAYLADYIEDIARRAQGHDT